MARWTSWAESNLLYLPSRAAFVTPAGARDVEFTSADGTRLHGWFIPAAGGRGEAKTAAVLHVHGNAGNISNHVFFSDFLPRAGVAVFIFDYRGYGRSEDRRCTREACMLDTEAAWGAMLAQPEVDAERAGVYGVSLGGSFAAHLAARRPEVRRLCTVAAFSSWSGVASDHAWLLGRLLIAGGLDARESVTKLGSRPYLIVHGVNDGIVGVHHGEKLFEAARAAGVPVELKRVAGADHNDILDHDPAVAGAIAAFFAGM